jgi:protein-disulfide isomerase
MKMEYTKVGGKENYDIVQKMQLSQIKDFVKQYKENPEMQKQIDGASKDTEKNTPAKETSSVLEKTQIASIKKDFALSGNPSAKVTIVEYSDLECPFCIKLFKSSAIPNVIAANKDSVNYMFKHFPLPMHPNAIKQHEALECAREA